MGKLLCTLCGAACGQQLLRDQSGKVVPADAAQQAQVQACTSWNRLAHACITPTDLNATSVPKQDLRFATQPVGDHLWPQ